MHISDISIITFMTGTDDSIPESGGGSFTNILLGLSMGFGGLAIMVFGLLRYIDSTEVIDSSCCLVGFGFVLTFSGMGPVLAVEKDLQVAALDSTLEDEERVIHSAIGSYGDDHKMVINHIIAATESRVFIRRQGILSDTVSIPYDKINSLRHGQKISGYEIEIHMSGITHRMIGLTEAVAPKELANFIQEKIDQTTSTVQIENGAIPTKESNADNLRELKSLLEEGIISEEEYENKRKEIIDRI